MGARVRWKGLSACALSVLASACATDQPMSPMATSAMAPPVPVARPQPPRMEEPVIIARADDFVIVRVRTGDSYASLAERFLRDAALADFVADANGAQPPAPEWGAMIAKGREFLLDQWWVATMPGIAILIASLGFNLLGDGLRDVLDPKQR